MCPVDFLTTDANSSALVFSAVPVERYALIERFYRAQGYKVRIAQNECIYVVYNAAEIVAAVRLVPQISGHFWLRNLLVAKTWRAQGVATGLMQYLLAFMQGRGCYCFALPHLQLFYEQLGFGLQPPHCPNDIQQKYQQYRTRGRDWLLMGYIRPQE